jgi:YesN/AraC family two-component response regulator
MLKRLTNFTSELSVLYVEDDDVTNENMSITLRRLFNRVVSVSNGMLALDAYKKDKFDIVITDIRMPLMNGVELIKSIKVLDWEQVVLVISAHDDSNYLMDLINLGIDRFIAKPIDKDRLLDGIYKLSEYLYNKKMIEQYNQNLEKAYINILNKNEELERYRRLINTNIKKTNLSYNKNIEDFVDKDYHSKILIMDIEEISDIFIDIESYVFFVLQNDNLSKNEYILKLSNSFNKLSLILKQYEFSNKLSYSFELLSKSLLSVNIKKIDNNFCLILEQFVFVIEQYIKSIWQSSSNEPNFYDASISADISMIVSLIK